MRHASRTLPLLALVLATTACATKSTTSPTVTGTPVLTQVPAPAPAFDPAGRWSVALVAQGQPLELTIELAKLEGDGNYGGTITSDVFPPMPISSAKLVGKRMVLTVPAPTGDQATLTMNFDGDLVSGDWAMPGDGGKLSGKRL
jgi:hypothetical protein